MFLLCVMKNNEIMVNLKFKGRLDLYLDVFDWLLTSIFDNQCLRLGITFFEYLSTKSFGFWDKILFVYKRLPSVCCVVKPICVCILALTMLAINPIKLSFIAIKVTW